MDNPSENAAGNAPYKVSIVLDRDFGVRLIPLSQEGPVWVIESPLNREAAEFLWKQNQTGSHLDGITVFKSFITNSLEDELITNLSTIDLHHGEYSTPVPHTVLKVIGLTNSPNIQAAFGTYGFNQFQNSADGFTALRD